MVDWPLAAVLGFALVGLAAIILMPRERRKKTGSSEDLYKGLDDYALLYTFLSQERFREMLGVLKRLQRSNRYSGEKAVLEKLEALVKKHA
ncbi:MAG: hypothetical protein QXR26_05825 [Candidatus Caldarchaeum sp.]